MASRWKVLKSKEVRLERTKGREIHDSSDYEGILHLDLLEWAIYARFEWMGWGWHS